MNKRQLDASYRAGFDIYNLGDYSKWTQRVLNFYKTTTTNVENLKDLSIGALLEVGKAMTPSQIIDIITKDLQLKWIPESDLCRFYIKWKAQLDKIMEMFNAVEKSVMIPSKYKGEWSRASNTVKVPPEIMLIDQLARRMNVTWDVASKFKWSEALFMNRIDKQQAYFDWLVQEKNKASRK